MCLAKEKLNEDDNTIPVFPLTLGKRPIKSKTLRANVSNPDYQSVQENNNNVLKNVKTTTNTSGSIRSPFTNCDSPLTYSHSTAPISTSESVKTRSMNCQGLSSSSSSSIQTNNNSLQNKNSRLQNICQSSSSPILPHSNSIERESDKNNDFFQYNQRDININEFQNDYYQQQQQYLYNCQQNRFTQTPIYNNNFKLN